MHEYYLSGIEIKQIVLIGNNPCQARINQIRIKTYEATNDQQSGNKKRLPH